MVKIQWTAKTDRAKNGSGLDPDKEPHWYRVRNPIFSETHAPLNLSSSSKDAHNSDVEDEFADKYDDEYDAGRADEELEEPTRKRTKVVPPPNKKAEKIKSTKHGLSAIARGINSSIIAQDRRFAAQMEMAKEREALLLKFRAEEAEKDRRHEERMMQFLCQ